LIQINATARRRAKLLPDAKAGDRMSRGELAYLTLVVVATVVFMAALAGVTWLTNRR
jgi:hypothetical protein